MKKKSKNPTATSISISRKQFLFSGLFFLALYIVLCFVCPYCIAESHDYIRGHGSGRYGLLILDSVGFDICFIALIPMVFVGISFSCFKFLSNNSLKKAVFSFKINTKNVENAQMIMEINARCHERSIQPRDFLNTTEIQNAIWRKWRDKLLSELREMDAKSFLWDSSLVNAVLELSNKHEVNLWDYIRGKPINTRRSIEKANNFVSWFAQICIDNHEEIVEKTKSYGNSFDKTSTTIEQRLLNIYDTIPTRSSLTIPSYYKDYQVFDAKNETYSFDDCIVDNEDNVVYYDNGYKQGDTKYARIPEGYRYFFRLDGYLDGYDVFDKTSDGIRRPFLYEIFLYTVYVLTLRNLYSVGIQPNKIGRLHYASPYSDPKGKERTIKFIKAVYKLKDEEPYASYSKSLRLGCDGIYGEKRDEYFENRRAYKSAIEYLRKSFNLVDYYAQVHFLDEVKEERNVFIKWFNEDAEELREKPLDIIE